MPRHIGKDARGAVAAFDVGQSATREMYAPPNDGATMTDAQLQAELRFRERLALSADLAAVLVEQDDHEARVLAEAQQRRTDLEDTQARLHRPGRLLSA